MNTTTELTDAIQLVFDREGRGIVDLVDDLLKTCPPQGLQLEWHAGRCTVRAVDNGAEELLNWPMPKSVFRGIMARVSARCNEREAGSVSPYGGEGELVVDAVEPATFRVKIANTADELKLDLIPISFDASSEDAH